MTYQAPIRRVETAKGHHYLDANGTRVPGVTTILGDGVPKAGLINWAANATADYAVDNWDELGDLSPSARLKKLQKARYEDRDTAAKRGTQVHALAEKLIHGEEVEVPDELAGHVESYVHLLDSWQFTPVLTEFTVVHYSVGYCGTADLIADVPGHGRLLMDIKTSRSGIFGETAWQLAAYRYAEKYRAFDELQLEMAELPMIEVDGCAGIHVRADGADLIPLTAGKREFRSFLYIKQVAEDVKASRDLVGAPLAPPNTTPRRRLELTQEEAP